MNMEKRDWSADAKRGSCTGGAGQTEKETNRETTRHQEQALQRLQTPLTESTGLSGEAGDLQQLPNLSRLNE